MQGPVGVDHHVARFTGETVGAPEQPPVDYKPGADPGTQGDQGNVLTIAAGPKSCLGHGGRRGVVGGGDRQSDGSLQLVSQRVVNCCGKVG